MNLITDTAYASEAVGETANAVGTLAEAINNYGPLIVLMAVFFVIFIVLIIAMILINYNMIKKMAATNTSQQNTEEGILKKFVDAALSELTKDDNIGDTISAKIKPLEKAIDQLQQQQEANAEDDYHKDLVGAYIDVNMTFKDASRAALKNLNCDRIGIYVFHNGNESMLGLPFFKMSCIHEWTPSGTNTLRGKSHCNMPLHLFNDFIEDLWKYGCYKSENIEITAATDPSIKEFVSFSKTQALYIMAIKDNDTDAITGFVVAEFNQPDTFEHDDERNTSVKDVLSTLIATISPIVCNRYIYKKDKDK